MAINTWPYNWIIIIFLMCPQFSSLGMNNTYFKRKNPSFHIANPIFPLQDCIEAENKFLVMKMVSQESEMCENFMCLVYFGRGLLRCAQKR